MADLAELQKHLKAMAVVVNAFNSESVQLRVVEVLLGQLDIAPQTEVHDDKGDKPGRRAKRRKSAKQGAKPEQSRTSDGNAAQEAKGAKAAKASKKSRGSGSPGGFAMVSQLLADGFFRKPQAIGAITTHCSTTKGHHYKANEISPGLLRLLRDGKLKRQKNTDGQYEYTQG